MRDKLMKMIGEGDEWGGIETIAAVQNMIEVNCVSFNLRHRTFFMPHFEKLYHQIVFVTFNGSNHYDNAKNIQNVLTKPYVCIRDL